MLKTIKLFLKLLSVIVVIVFIALLWTNKLSNKSYIQSELIINSVGNSLNKLNYFQESNNDSKIIKTSSEKNPLYNELIYQKIKEIIAGSNFEISLAVKTLNVE